MRKTLKISSTLHARLEFLALDHGFRSIAQLLEVWQTEQDELSQRKDTMQRIGQMRQLLCATLWRDCMMNYGTPILEATL